MNQSELQALKKAYFAESLKKHPYIPLECYVLPSDVITCYEQLKAEKAQKGKETKSHTFVATRGEVSLQRRTRRAVGDYSIDEEE